MLFLWIFGNNVEDAMGPVKYLLFYLLGGVAALALQIVVDPSSTIPTLGASGAIAGRARRLHPAVPPREGVTVIFIVFFFTILELPAMLVLGHLVPAAGAVRLLRPRASGGGAAASRTSPTWAASCSGCWPSAAAGQAQAGGPSDRAGDGPRDPALPHGRLLLIASADVGAHYLIGDSADAPVVKTATAPPGTAEGLRDRAAGRRRHRALAARGPARPARRPGHDQVQEAAARRRCCSTSTPAACSIATTRPRSSRSRR